MVEENGLLSEVEGAKDQLNSEEVSWWYDDGIPGKGEKPEYFVDSKYKTLAEQAKAYPNAQQMLGGMTGSPEEYEIKLQEEIAKQVEFDESDPLISQFKDYAKKKNFSQETFTDLLNMLGYNLVKEFEDEKKMQSEYTDKQKKALGENAPDRLKTVSKWVKNNVPEKYESVIKNLGKSADGVMFLEHIIQSSQVTNIPTTTGTITSEERRSALRELMSDPRYGKSAEYDKYVESQYERALGQKA